MYALLGSHCTGKTTLLHSVKQKEPTLYVTDGFSRPIQNVGRELILSKFEQQSIINQLSLWAHKQYSFNSYVLTGRSLIDCIVYSEVLFSPHLADRLTRPLYKQLNSCLKQFNRIFYIPIEFEWEGDGERYGSTMQNKIDRRIQTFIKDNSLLSQKIVTISGSINQRTDQVIQAINEK